MYFVFLEISFKVAVHDSTVYPDDSNTVLVEAGNEAFVGVQPDLYYSTKEVFSRQVNIRMCYGTSEIDLHVLEFYSYLNC